VNTSVRTQLEQPCRGAESSFGLCRNSLTSFGWHSPDSKDVLQSEHFANSISMWKVRRALYRTPTESCVGGLDWPVRH
jgi:hypothetical protein